MLLYLPIKRGSLLSRYFGPYVVHKLVNDTEYVLNTPVRDRKSRYCGINLLKGYVDRLSIVPVLPVQTESYLSNPL